MDFENLQTMDKSEFLPLGTVKQELLDAANGITNDADATEKTIQINSDDSETVEATNPVCDSAEKQNDGDKSDANDDSSYRKCVFCSQSLGAKDIPKLLECLHKACDACITSKFSEIDTIQPAVLQCPTCKTPTAQDAIIMDQFLIELSEANPDEQSASEVDAQTIKCSSCADDASATSWCVECAEYICDGCVQAHQRLKITKDHTIKTKEEALTENQSSTNDDKMLMCHVHTQEKLSLFCETCDKLTCRDCQLVDHRDHKYKFANEIASETRESLDVLLNEITYKRVLLNSAMNVIDERQKLIADKQKELATEITTMVYRLTQAVNLRSKQLVHRLSEVCDGKLKVLNEKKEALQHLSNHTDHCISFVKFALESGSDSAVLYSKKTLTSHLQKVKSQRADIPNPEIPVRIQVQMNQVPELQKVISQLGTIIVDGKAYPPTVSPAPNATRPLTSPSNVNRIETNLNNQNMVNAPPAMQAQAPMPNHRSMPPPSRSPQVPGSISLRNNLYGGNTPPMQQPANFPQQTQQPCNMTRPFPQDNTIGNFGRFPNMGPRQTQFRQIAPHVSSSTHPQNMEISLRGLLTQGGPNQPVGQMQCAPGNEFNTLFGQPISQQQGLPAQGMQMGHFPGITNPQSQNMLHAQRRPQQQQQQQQQQQHQQPHQQQPQQQIHQQPPHQQHQQSHQHQQMDRIQMHKQQLMQQQRSAMPPNYNIQQTMPTLANQINQRPNLPNNEMFLGQQMNFQSNNPPLMNSNCSPPGSSWHIPQSGRSNGSATNNQPTQNPLSMQFCTNGRLNENSFKISLKPQNTLKQAPPPSQPTASVPSTVTSTNPKTPSPSTNDNAKDISDSIDKACADTVNDLMATIAKLDSNGVQVLPEGQRGKTTSPQVSSTDYSLIAEADKNNKDDPNEDWCAVCSDGGELMCCDKCPKVFHQHCHIPIINPFPDENEPWQCMLCYNFNEMPLEPVIGDKRSAGLSSAEHKRIQRILLELYCQSERSSMFRDLEPESNISYYEIIKNAITLDIIRSKLDPINPERYRDVPSFIDDIRLLFNNVYLFYREDSKIYKNARYLEKFFEEQLTKLLPDYLPKRNSLNGSNRAHEAKRPRIERATEIIDDGDDDVILTG